MASPNHRKRWFNVAVVLCAFLAKACLLSFGDYAEGDVCAAGLDAGFRPNTAPDPVLRGCDAGPSAKKSDEASASPDGAGGAGGSP